ncbi:MAG: electron transfer flavoprotein subunit beta [Actinomycetia bacterium]|nr:electron transfer flavoprotein subunit beta [Actinomycetes bacterium]
MRIVSLVKHTPDIEGDRRFAADGTLDRAAAEGRPCELDEYAAEQALQLAETHPGTQVTYLTMGPEDAASSLRKLLAMGGDGGVHVLDSGLHGSDAQASAAVLAAAIRRLGFDLVLCGMASTDAGMGVVPAMIADYLGVPQLTYAGRLSVADGSVEIDRETDTATQTYTASLPALVSVTDRTGEARYPSFKGIMAAKKKPVEVLSLADLAIEPARAGAAAAWTVVRDITPRPPRQAGERVMDDGAGGAVLADFLAARKFI